MALLCQGNIKEAESSVLRSTQLDPLSAVDCARIAYIYYVKGDYRSAADHLQRSFDLDRDYPEARFYEGLLHFQQGNYDGVAHCLSASLAPLDIGLLAAAHARRGSRSRAEEDLEKLRELAAKHYVTPLAEALAAIGMGDLGLAFQRLDEAIDHKTNFVNMSGIDPFFNPLRRDARFTSVLKRLNLPH
jgi:serine/threonine-protein kinase